MPEDRVSHRFACVCRRIALLLICVVIAALKTISVPAVAGPRVPFSAGDRRSNRAIHREGSPH